MYKINSTHEPTLKSWIESANEPGTDFPIQNLPYCVFQQSSGKPSIGVGIGDQILDLGVCAGTGLLSDNFGDVASQPTLNGLMGLAVDDQSQLRRLIMGLLIEDTSRDKTIIEQALVLQSDVTLLMPCVIGDYSDFYASVYHATNVGSMFRPDNPLLPNYKHIPIGYHGRASSIVVSGTPIHRPVGQLSPTEEGGNPTRAACKLLDYELEVGCFVGRGNKLGGAISINDAEEHLFGLTLLNDWSARDIQKWEYQPLGPFLAKSFASTISPWIVTMEALAPFRCAEFARPEGDPTPLEYLASESNSKFGGVDLQLEVYLRTEKMQQQRLDPQLLTRGSFTNLYWTLAQMLTHHSSNGCNMRAGDMLGSGTVSGLARDSRGCLLELTWDGDQTNAVPGSQRTPIKLPTGEERKFLADGDEVIIKGFCETDSHRRIGFGVCAGKILPAQNV
jgi:fumarylacetoacetase